MSYYALTGDKKSSLGTDKTSLGISSLINVTNIVLVTYDPDLIILTPNS